MVNTCGEIEHCTPRTEATPSGEGVASLGGGWREAGEEGGRASSLPPPTAQGGSEASLGGGWLTHHPGREGGRAAATHHPGTFQLLEYQMVRVGGQI